MKFNIEDITDPVLREIYAPEHDDAIKKAVEQISIEVIELCSDHQNQIYEKFPKLNCQTGKSYVDTDMTYSLITNLLQVLLSNSDQVGKEAIRDMLDSDIADMIYGEPSDEDLAQASDKKDIMEWMEKEVDTLVDHLAGCMDTEDTKNTVTATGDMNYRKYPDLTFTLQVSVRRKGEKIDE